MKFDEPQPRRWSRVEPVWLKRTKQARTLFSGAPATAGDRRRLPATAGDYRSLG